MYHWLLSFICRQISTSYSKNDMHTIAIIADIHGNLPALRVVAEDIVRRGIPTVVNLGDHASGPLWPAETLNYLMQQPWTQIAGNHDRQLVELSSDTMGASDRYAIEQLSPAQLAWLGALPATARIGDAILACHGTPTENNRYLLETVERGSVRLAKPDEITDRIGDVEAEIVLCGHTHLPRLIQALEQLLVINPGSVGLGAYTDQEPEPHAVEVGSPHARYAILEQQGPQHMVTFVTLPYDHFAAAQRAYENGRPDWAVALRTGRAAL
jgi:predicted phosphodiesterase